MTLQLPQTSSHMDRQTSSPRPKGRGKWTSIGGKETAVKKESSGVRSARELLRTMAEIHCVFAEVGTCNHMCVTCVSLCVTCVSHDIRGIVDFGCSNPEQPSSQAEVYLQSVNYIQVNSIA